MTDQPSTFRGGLGAAVPVALGYFPIAFSFGVAATRAGFSPAEAMVFSTVMYSGAGQFLGITLVSGGVPLLVSVITLAAMALRHVIYGPTVLKAAGADARTRFAPFWGFWLTDEVFGAALGELARGQQFSERFMAGLGFGAWAAWGSGTLLGALVGGGALAAYPAVEAGLGFMLPALFLALLLSILSRAQVPVIAVAGLVTTGVTLAGSPTAGILLGMLAGALAGLARKGAA